MPSSACQWGAEKRGEAAVGGERTRKRRESPAVTHEGRDGACGQSLREKNPGLWGLGGGGGYPFRR